VRSDSDAPRGRPVGSAVARPGPGTSGLSPSLRARVCRPYARVRVRLLGPCYETGRARPSRRRPWGTRGNAPSSRRPPPDPARQTSGAGSALPVRSPVRRGGRTPFASDRRDVPDGGARAPPGGNARPHPEPRPPQRSHVDPRSLRVRRGRRARGGGGPERTSPSAPAFPTRRDRTGRPRATVAPASLLTISSAFDLFFKVLFTFPSPYFFAIGFPPVFSLGWDLPPYSGCIPKQPDSAKATHASEGYGDRYTGTSPSTSPPFRTACIPATPPWGAVERLQFGGSEDPPI
jgi:hypothetical protein